MLSRTDSPATIAPGIIRTSTSSLCGGMSSGFTHPVLLHIAQNRGFGVGAVFGSHPLGHGISKDAEPVTGVHRVFALLVAGLEAASRLVCWQEKRSFVPTLRVAVLLTRCKRQSSHRIRCLVLAVRVLSQDSYVFVVLGVAQFCVPRKRMLSLGLLGRSAKHANEAGHVSRGFRIRCCAERRTASLQTDLFHAVFLRGTTLWSRRCFRLCFHVGLPLLSSSLGVSHGTSVRVAATNHLKIPLRGASAFRRYAIE